MVPSKDEAKPRSDSSACPGSTTRGSLRDHTIRQESSTPPKRCRRSKTAKKLVATLSFVRAVLALRKKVCHPTIRSQGRTTILEWGATLKSH